MILTFQQNDDGNFYFYSTSGKEQFTFCSDFRKLCPITKGKVTLAKKNPKKKGFKKVIIHPGWWTKIGNKKVNEYPDGQARPWLQHFAIGKNDVNLVFSFYAKIEA